jgi:hypothetical protein
MYLLLTSSRELQNLIWVILLIDFNVVTFNSDKTTLALVGPSPLRPKMVPKTNFFFKKKKLPHLYIYI